MLNNVVIMGRLVHDPELKYGQSGVAYLRARIACQRNTKNAEGGYDADFFTVQLWRQTAEFVANYMNKGDMIAVTGRLKQTHWTGRDGSNREGVEIDGFTAEAAGGRAGRENAAKPENRAVSGGYEGLTPVNDDDYNPFEDE